jgi:hypothetical protein
MERGGGGGGSNGSSNTRVESSNTLDVAGGTKAHVRNICRISESVCVAKQGTPCDQRVCITGGAGACVVGGGGGPRETLFVVLLLMMNNGILRPGFQGKNKVLKMAPIQDLKMAPAP